jgi:hypothetical protein
MPTVTFHLLHCFFIITHERRDYVHSYHDDRTQLGLRKQTPNGRTRPGSCGTVISFPRLGGLHHRYERAA